MISRTISGSPENVPPSYMPSPALTRFMDSVSNGGQPSLREDAVGQAQQLRSVPVHAGDTHAVKQQHVGLSASAEPFGAAAALGGGGGGGGAADGGDGGGSDQRCCRPPSNLSSLISPRMLFSCFAPRS